MDVDHACRQDVKISLVREPHVRPGNMFLLPIDTERCHNGIDQFLCPIASPAMKVLYRRSRTEL